VGGAGSRKFKCTWCHTEIARRLTNKEGLHPVLMAHKTGDDACIKCHSEHNGKDFVPILWDVSLDQFDHRKTGYPLEGGHAHLDCKRCHSPEHIAPAARKNIRMRDLRRTYLGLTTACMGCHQDQHGGQVGSVCERCHVVAKWKDLSHFDHARAKYPLNGAHERVACAKCHKPEAIPGSDKTRIRYAGIPFAQCQDCHQDPHKGSFKAACASCHNERGWKSVTNSPSAFDHSKTKYPLLGKHAAVACEKCHKTANFKQPLAHEACKDCHQDAHGGQFNQRADKGECASCHTVDGWKPTTFTVASHAKSAYPLLGKHAAVVCEKCHRPAGKATQYHVKFQACLDCHTDVHKGQFAGAPHKNRCEDCHTVQRFAPASFSLARHRETRFPLEGGHAAVACVECHKVQPDGRNVAAYHFADITCETCHFDPHQGQFAERMRASSAKGKASGRTGCEACHVVRSWHEVPAFDHSTTRFALTGAHKGVSCDQCHRATASSVGLKRVLYRDVNLRQCADCHEDIHFGQFQALTGESKNCAACHDTGLWRPARFDHDKAKFKLGGAHKNVPCAGCHKTRREMGGRLVLFYAPTPKECSDCHGSKITH
jgi:hypothetical protein